jgi:hypothetical protein
MSESRCDPESELRELHAQMLKALDEAAVLRSDRSPEVAAKWVKKIGAAATALAKANVIVGMCSVEQRDAHLKLVARTLALLQAAVEGHRNSLDLGNFAIVLAWEEFGRKWGAGR